MLLESHIMVDKKIIVKVKKGKLSLCLTKYYDRKMYRGVEVFLYLGTSRRWVVSFTPPAFYPRGRSPGTHWIGGWVDPRAGMSDIEKWKFLTLPGLLLRPLGRPARSQMLYSYVLNFTFSVCVNKLQFQFYYFFFISLAVQLCLTFFSVYNTKSKLLYDWRSVSQYVLVSGTPLGPMTRFYFFLSFVGKFSLLLGRPLWREDGSAICTVICQWSESRRTSNHTLLVSSETTGFPFRRLLRLAEITAEVFLPASARVRLQYTDHPVFINWDVTQ
jgi:hypothetical protein